MIPISWKRQTFQIRRAFMKRYRIMKIKEIIQNQVIETQEELAEALKKEGIAVTQATVSRDIKDLMLIKIPYKNGHYRYALSNEKQSVMSKSHTAILFQEAVVKIDSAMNYLLKNKYTIIIYSWQNRVFIYAIIFSTPTGDT